MTDKMKMFKSDLQKLINRHSLENRSNTPDFILAEYLVDCLHSFELATQERERWYNIKLEPGKKA